ncbi:type IV secretion system protein [Bartonella taylorii]|uniref:Conjugal transfer protein n=1 Tax=Bartonella taylorii TaxID=33046 RepID=A0A9Q9DLR3_BARTA|nr:type IV secretion system protein [Bartonella taylorii]USP02382.1 conjugal transfer protein [Bartonella taylorii]
MKKLIITTVMSVFFGTSSYGQSSVQVNFTEKIYDSITGTRTISKAPQRDDGSLYLLNPQFIYSEDKQAEIAKTVPTLFRNTIKDENYLRNASVSEARETIDERNQYAAVIDKAVALQIFQEIDNRFQQIANMLVTLDQMQDLKGIAELQVRMKGMLAMIQNETAKLQMVAHSRDIEQTLISRLQRKRNIQILGSRNTQMPKIR